jgi:predicted HTH transcriptional regulator
MTERPSLEDLEAALRQGASEYLELKRQFTSDAQIAPTLVAFANADGGLLLFGVSDTPAGFEVTGLSDAEAARTADRLWHLVS